MKAFEVSEKDRKFQEITRGMLEGRISVKDGCMEIADLMEEQEKLPLGFRGRVEEMAGAGR